eukprot:CAMPEP_0197024088 /NCGR_PEP_ID=MMETSP1384-20130603/4730_1 /TAXON_ID=29189 /ORGANISM="Ammonia sp." /LENGTH=323 /DNA_ID=CAMNT_0042452425 /DNA_START=263 /DNA_END=1234 /DNA_ORIENTATION=-
MYSKCHQLLKSSSASSCHSALRQQFKSRLINTSIGSSANGTFKYSANISNGDCVRLAFIYGLCGTFSSYLSMNYDGKVLIFRWSVPTPERFVFCVWCWSLAGMATWRLFWTRPDALIRAAASRIRYGLFHGSQTTAIAMNLSFATIAFWSFHFDVKDWQYQYGEWQKSVTPTGSSLMTENLSRGSTPTSTSNGLIEEEDEVKVNLVNMDEMDSGVQIINNALEQSESERSTQSNKSAGPTVMSKPTWPTGQQLLSNAYEPCKIFFFCNAPIWILTGNVTGMIAARILTNSIILNPTAAAAGFASMCCIENQPRIQTDSCLLDE